MANEVMLTAKLKCLNGDLKIERDVTSLLIDQAVQGQYHNVQLITFAGEVDIVIGTMTNYGVCFLRNLDQTNYIKVGKKVAGVMEASMRLRKRQPALFPLEPGITLRAQANTADCRLEVIVLEL